MAAKQFGTDGGTHSAPVVNPDTGRTHEQTQAKLTHRPALHYVGLNVWTGGFESVFYCSLKCRDDCNVQIISKLLTLQLGPMDSSDIQTHGTK